MATTSAGTPRLSSESEGTERVRMFFVVWAGELLVSFNFTQNHFELTQT